jgi:hypothetical protein
MGFGSTALERMNLKDMGFKPALTCLSIPYLSAFSGMAIAPSVAAADPPASTPPEVYQGMDADVAGIEWATLNSPFNVSRGETSAAPLFSPLTATETTSRLSEPQIVPNQESGSSLAWQALSDGAATGDSGDGSFSLSDSFSEAGSVPLQFPEMREMREPIQAQAESGAEEQPPHRQDSDSQIDPELGDLRLQFPEADPELGVLRLQPPTDRPEIDVDDLFRPRRPPATVYLLGGVTAFRSDNIFSSQVDPVGDALIAPGLTLYAQPQLDSDTYLVAAVGGYLVRYVDFPEVDYNELRLRLGLRQILSPQMYGEISWTNAQLFDRERGDRFLNDHSLRLLLVRSDPLAPRLALDSFYQFRGTASDPSDRSRLSNTLGTALVYEVTSDFSAALDYQFAWTTFLNQGRDDFYHELVAELRYALTQSMQVNVYGGFSFGHSSDRDINFNGGILGIGLFFQVPLF